MKPATPFDKVQLIEHSLRCFAFGMAGILPGIGLPFAIIALGNYFRTNRHKGDAWNPAERYMGIGAFCATVGLGITLLLAGVLYVEIS